MYSRRATWACTQFMSLHETSSHTLNFVLKHSDLDNEY
jgi:hypothetical protein